MEKDNFSTHLYFIRDRLSKAPETAVIQSVNDAVAVRGFSEYLKANAQMRKEKGLAEIHPVERELVHICSLDEANHVIVGFKDGIAEDDYRVVCRGDTVNDYLNDIREGLRGDEE